MKQPNILFLCSDEHARNALHCFGADFIHSPNLDRLAATGVRFTQAYTTSPLCVPARASLVTGKYVHTIGCWDNGHPYHGVPPGWPHKLRALGYCTVSIGKNHFRSVADDNGFDTELLPMHVRDGVGDVFGMLRHRQIAYSRGFGGNEAEKELRATAGPATLAATAGPGESNHTRYDRSIAGAACDWLREHGQTARPWALFVSFVSPHFPLIAPPEFYELYTHGTVPPPARYTPEERPVHPVVQALTRVWNFDDFFDAEALERARTAYFALVSFLDANIGQVLHALDGSGARDDTLVLYLSDHGEMLGNKGIWSTSALYEESVGVPLIIRGPGAGRGVSDVLVSHVDVLPTLLHAATGDPAAAPGPGRSLLERAPADRKRIIMSEYHAGGSITGCYMIRTGRWKYHHYVGYPPELFDLQNDPQECRDLGADPGHAGVRERCEAALRAIVDPDDANERAFADQARVIQRWGGEEALLARKQPGEHSLDRDLGKD